jgi:hypothetical protein
MFKKNNIKFKCDDGTRAVVKGFTGVIPIYNRQVDLVFGNDELMRRWKGGSSNAWVYTDKTERFIVYFSSDAHVRSVVHESYHIMNHLQKWFALSDDDANEQQAYLIDYIFGEIMKVKPKWLK